MQQGEESGMRVLTRLRVEIAQRELVIAIKDHHRDVEGGVRNSVGVRLKLLNIQHRVAQGGESISNLGPMLFAFAY